MAAQPRRRFVDTSCGQVHYRVQGDMGPAIVLLHINQQSSLLYLELMGLLARSFRVFAMDYPFYGMSDHPDRDLEIRDYADCIAALMDQEGISSTFLLGEAVGSAIAVSFAVERPEQTLGVVLLNCPLMPSKDFARDHIGAIRAHQRPTDATGFPLLQTLDQVLERSPEHVPLHPTQSWMDRINVSLALCGRDRWQASEALLRFDLREALSRLASPALLLTAEFSPFADYREDVERTANGILSEVVPGCRFGMGWERADEVSARVTHFASEFRGGEPQ